MRSGLIWGEATETGADADSVSPLPGGPVHKGRALAEADVASLLTSTHTVCPEDAVELASRLKSPFRGVVPDLLGTIVQETGFSQSDARECVLACFTVLDAFAEGYPGASTSEGGDFLYSGPLRSIVLRHAPYGTIAVTLPRNAFPYLALLTALSGLRAGNRVVLKAPSHCGGTLEILVSVLSEVRPASRSVSLVAADGRTFAQASLASENVGLFHFMGGSATGGQLLQTGFEAGKSVLMDGDGNTWCYVCDSADPDEAATTLVRAATRYNGQTCTSVNGIVAHPAVFGPLKAALTRHMAETESGDPRDSRIQVGPLFSEDQARAVLDLVDGAGGHVLAGGRRDGNLVQPTLVESPEPRSDWVREGAFGPCAWLCEGNEEDFWTLWQANRYPLAAGVLSERPEVQEAFARLPRLARLTVNGDPSIEDPMEPWGGYPCSANSPVTNWVDRYRRVVQVEGPTL